MKSIDFYNSKKLAYVKTYKNAGIMIYIVYNKTVFTVVMIHEISTPIKIFQAVLDFCGKAKPRWFRPCLKKKKGEGTEDVASKTWRLIINYSN